MKANLIVSSRGQLTLPAELRKKYGIKEGTILVAEDSNGEIVLKPATVLEVDFYSDKEIGEWALADQFKDEKESKTLRAQLQKVAKIK